MHTKLIQYDHSANAPFTKVNLERKENEYYTHTCTYTSISLIYKTCELLVKPCNRDKTENGTNDFIRPCMFFSVFEGKNAE